MGVLATRAKAHQQTGQASPRYQMLIDGTDFTDRVESITGSYEIENGASSFSFSLTDPRVDLRELQDTQAVLWLGYGDELIPYMAGKVQEPYTPSRAALPKAVAYGPFMEMGNQYMVQDHDYTGQSLEAMSLDLGRRAGLPAGALEVVNGSSVEIREGYQTAETALLEAQKAAVGSLNFVMSDMPGYKRLVAPAPVPGSDDPFVTEYTESDYEPDGFDPIPESGVKFSRVIAFRRSEDGSYPVWEWAYVPNLSNIPVPANRIYWIPEFAGDSAQALRTVNRKAMQLARQSYAFSLTAQINPEIIPLSSIRASRVERVGRDWVTATYQGIVRRINIEVSRDVFRGGYEGQAIKVNEEPFVPEIRRRRKMDPSIVLYREQGPPIPAGGITWDNMVYSLQDLRMYTWEELS